VIVDEGTDTIMAMPARDQFATDLAAIRPSVEVDRPAGSAPKVVIQPSRGFVSLNLRDLWRYRDLLYVLTSR